MHGFHNHKEDFIPVKNDERKNKCLKTKERDLQCNKRISKGKIRVWNAKGTKERVSQVASAPSTKVFMKITVMPCMLMTPSP